MKKRIVSIFMLCIFLCGCNDGNIPKENQKNETLTEETVPVQSETVQKETKQPNSTSESAKNETTNSLSTEDNRKKEKETLHFYDEQTKKWYDTTINSKVKKHQYDWSCLSNTKNGISYTGAYSIRKGVDVSHHQGAIDWEKVKADGYEFAILRIGYRGYGKSGGLYVDNEFKNNIRDAHKAGLDVGVYIFSQAINETEALEEADLVIEQLQGETLELPVTFDPELIRTDDARTDNVTGEQFTKNTIAFCEKIEKAGYKAMIYSNMYWESFLFDLEQLSDFPIWYADYEKVPQTPYEFEFWQYSDKGQVDGISGKTDLNIQFYTKE